MNIIHFNSDTKHRKQWFTGLSFSHPAKMALPLQLWLIDNFTKEGETILDPMAGSGTLLVACSMGRNVICVELEQKFVDMMKGNWEKIQQRGCQLGYQMGTATILQGDARNLTGILADKIITSPPYAESDMKSPVVDKNRQVVRKLATHNLEYAKDPDNLGNLPYGSIDAVISSPPYEGVEARDRSKESWWDEERETKLAGGSAKIAKGYQVDAVISSPPYEASNIRQGDKAFDTVGVGEPTNYNRGNPENIGNLKSASYLEAMLVVYQQCYAVLKPDGLMVLVVKNFIRNKAIVRLDLDTIKLCKQAGFTFQDRWYRELTQQSFWRTIYHQKYPDVEPIKYEDCLIFQKGI